MDTPVIKLGRAIMAMTMTVAAEDHRRVAGTNVFEQVVAAVSAMYARHATRQRLADLDDRLLRDIGLEREDVMRELGKPFWRL